MAESAEHIHLCRRVGNLIARLHVSRGLVAIADVLLPADSCKYSCMLGGNFNTNICDAVANLCDLHHLHCRLDAHPVVYR